MLTYTWIHSLLPYMEYASLYKQYGNGATNGYIGYIGATQANNGLTYVGPSSDVYTWSNGQAINASGLALFTARTFPISGLFCPSDLAAPVAPTISGRTFRWLVPRQLRRQRGHSQYLRRRVYRLVHLAEQGVHELHLSESNANDHGFHERAGDF